MSKIRSLWPRVLALTIGLGCAGAVHAQGVVRVEPRPFYGAVVTMESGVRVFRPLPADRYIVINPGHATPLSLGIQDTRVYERRTIHNYNHSDGGDGGDSYSYSGGAYVPGYGGAYRGGYRGGHHRGGYRGHRHGHGGRGHN